MRVLITGPQGSGKTTQAEILAKQLNFCLVVVGDMVRRLAEENSEEGKRVKASLEKGEMVDDQIMGSLVRRNLSREDCREGAVVDGYPRTLSQLKVFDPDFEVVFYLDMTDEEVLERLLKRGRADDTPQLIEARLGLYHQYTLPVLTYYEKLGKLVRVNGSQSIEKVAENIMSYLEQLGYDK